MLNVTYPPEVNLDPLSYGALWDILEVCLGVRDPISFATIH